MGKKVAIFLHGQQGDILEASSVLRFKDELWGEDCEITWFCQEENRDLFKFNPYLKLKQFPHGYGIPQSDMDTIYADRIAKDKADGKPEWFDLSLVKTHDNKLDIEKKHLWEPIIGSFNLGFFPAPHQMSPEQRHGLEYSLCSKKVFGLLERDWCLWHPVLYWSKEEIDNAHAIRDLILSQNKKIVLIETYCGSGQSRMNDETVKISMRLCQEKWGNCAFVFVSHKYLNNQPEFPIWLKSQDNVYFDTSLTVRQVALFNDFADLFICISSGISVATSAWGLEPTPKFQYCGSEICSTKSIANGPFHLVTSDFIAEPEPIFERELKQFLITLN
ncbi:MAG TPA: hypothetical protein PK289_01245 [Bacteroidia bacterium]|nr:hypothetical protein [Bacteroidia bacterium]